MSIRITISLDESTERSIRALARKKRKTISGLIRDFVAAASKKEGIIVNEQGLGYSLRSPRKVLKDTEKDYKTLLEEIREEKFSRR